MRGKWDEQRGTWTYGERTIRRALAGRTEFYGSEPDWEVVLLDDDEDFESTEDGAHDTHDTMTPGSSPLRTTPTGDASDTYDTMTPYVAPIRYRSVGGPGFPLHALPPTLRRYLEEAAHAKEAPVEFVAVPMLAALGVAIGASRRFMIERTWLELPTLYTAVVAPPASGKSPAEDAGIGLAQVAAARGYRLVLCLPNSMSEERKRTLLAYGAELVLTDPERRMLAAIEEAEKIRDATGAWMPNQFANPANPRIHYETTAPELWAQMDGRIDAFVYGSGTGGTISGVGRFLKERRPDTLVVAVEPARSPVLSGGERGQHQFQGMGPGFVPPNFDRSVVDRVMQAWEETAFPLARRLAREEGLFVGMSSGAIAWAALGVARELGAGARVLCIAPDSGARYLSTALFNPGA